MRWEIHADDGSVAVSIDGYIDDTSSQRLLLSSAEDFDRVDAVRAECDALLIGAGTLRQDNPRLLVGSEQRRAARLARGLPAHPLKVVVTASGDLDPGLRFWHCGGRKTVYTRCVPEAVRQQFRGAAEIVELGPALGLPAILDDLAARGVRRLLVEGGGSIHTQFLKEDLADELHVAHAPVLVGAEKAPRFLRPARFPGGAKRRMKLIDVQQLGDTVLHRYAPRGAA
ncbi:dihydrofolate reductase family protein (plasmid) [Streptomyces sp. Q6]|uniref:Dihydrofolate reductase family protein n=1 Tax=Streptomyces citrinus TaxID=3118173 RepID=A0ACD5ARH6_9ACTN